MSAVIRAKVKITQVSTPGTATENNQQEYVTAFAVYDSDPNSENGQWSKYTPALSLNMTINNEKAFGKLKEGQEFYLDFIPVEKPAETE